MRSIDDLLISNKKNMYIKQDFSHLLGIEGFSDKALNTHFSLYEGYVNNTNKILEKLQELEAEGKTGEPEFGELKRRFGWEFDGMRLHEYYFGGLGVNGEIDKSGKLYKAIEENFGSFDKFKENFINTGKTRGIGWVILYQDLKQEGKLINFWINEHDTGHGAGLNPILVVDVFEHAYMIDYGTNRAGYLDAYWKNIKWSEIETRIK